MADQSEVEPKKQAATPGVRTGSGSKKRSRPDKDPDILEFVRKNPIAHVKEIAHAVGLGRGATSARITQLKKTKRLRSGMTVDLRALGFDHRYRIDIRVNPRRLREEVDKAKAAIEAQKKGKTTIDSGELFETLANSEPLRHLTNHQEILAFHILRIGENNPTLVVEDVSVILGDPADLCATVRVKSPPREAPQGDDPIYKLVTENLRSMSSIEGTSTCIEAWSCSQKMQDLLLDSRPTRKRS